MANRSYGQYCGVARALDLVGERWALLVVRGLVLGPKRFTDLQADLPGVGTNVLSTRLRELERDGVIHRRTLPPPAGSTVYELTEYGRELEPVLLAFGRWGAQSLGRRAAGQSLRSGWIGVATRAFVRPGAVPVVCGDVEVRLDDSTFHIRLESDGASVADGPAESPDLVVEAPNDAILAVLAGIVEPTDAVAAGTLALAGDERLLDALLEVVTFSAPEHGPEAR